MVVEDAVILAAIRCASGYLNMEYSVVLSEILVSTPRGKFYMIFSNIIFYSNKKYAIPGNTAKKVDVIFGFVR